MIKVEIKKQGEVTHGADFETQEEVQQWIASCEATEAWGKPEHQVEVSPALPEIVDLETGEVLQHAQEAAMETVPAEYTIVISDITSEIEQARINTEALQYLADTDWMAIRAAEGGAPMPEEVRIARQEARDKVVR